MYVSGQGTALCFFSPCRSRVHDFQGKPTNRCVKGKALFSTSPQYFASLCYSIVVAKNCIIVVTKLCTLCPRLNAHVYIGAFFARTIVTDCMCSFHHKIQWNCVQNVKLGRLNYIMRRPCYTERAVSWVLLPIYLLYTKT